jgi:phosphoglycolate phosphatase
MKAVFFDFDGVIADSRTAIRRCLDAVLLQRGLQPLDDAILNEVIGPPLAEGIELVLASRKADLQNVGQCVREFRQRYARVSLEATVLQPGMLHALRVLAEHVPLALATSKPLSLTEPLLQQLAIRELFSAVAAPPPERDGEPKTATLRHAVTRLAEALGRSINPAQAAMVGDRHHDIAAGKALRMTTIGVAWGCGSLTELRVAGADSIVSNPRELVATLLTARQYPPCRARDTI